MKNLAFTHTVEQIRNQTKTVTRRVGWSKLKPGDRLMACVKCQGLKKGGHVEKIRVIEVVSVHRERISQIFAHGPDESEREGFPDLTSGGLISLICRVTGLKAWDEVNRIQFRYPEDET